MIDERLRSVRTVLCDLDGVVWLAHEPIPGAVEAIARLRAAGRRVVFVTNNSVARIEDHVAALGRIGVPASGDVISSSTAAAHLIEPGERVLVTGGPGIVQAVEQRGGVAVLNDGTTPTGAGFDAVVVGLDRTFDYGRLTVASAAIQGGARLIGTNSDSTYPTPRGLEPGGGAIVAAVAAAGEVTPTFAGKPHPPMARAIEALLAGGPGERFDASTTVMVGDRPETDGLMAQRLGCSFALVRSGVVRPGQVVDLDLSSTVDLPDLAAVADAVSPAVR